MNGGEVEYRVKVDPKQAEKGVQDIEKTFGQLKNAAGKLFAGISAAKAAGWLADISKQAISAYADFEQLTGGVETLFKESADTVKGYAQQAFENVGMSANEYMETVTGFSASLIASLGGDTQKAAAAADLAITDIADNANKMGSSMESIKNAYQGFAKGQYQLLDNLKLGYGGTKTEMERLLADAEKLQAAQGKAVEYSIDSFSDIVEAIHVVQDEWGITGTTAREAAETISGSAAAMKAAWQNLLTGFADPAQDVKKLTDDLTKSVQTFIKNVLPQLGSVLERLPEGLADIADAILPVIPELIEKLLPAAAEGMRSLVQGIAGTARDMLPVLLSTLDEMADELDDNSEEMVGELVDAIISFLDGDLPQLTEEALKVARKLIFALIDGVVTNAPKLIEKGPELIIDLLSGMTEILGDFGTLGMEICNRIADILVHFDWGDIAKTTILNLADSLDEWRQKLIDLLPDNAVIQGAFSGMALTDGFTEYMRKGADEISDWIGKTADKIAENYDKYGLKVGRKAAKFKTNVEHYMDQKTLDEQGKNAKKVLEKYGKNVSSGGDKIVDAGEQLEKELEDLDHKLAVHAVSEESYWAQRKNILEKYRDEESEDWWKYYDKVTEYYEKAQDAEDKAQKESEKEKQQAIKDSYEKIETNAYAREYASDLDREADILEKELAFLAEHKAEMSEELFGELYAKWVKDDEAYRKKLQSQADKDAKQLDTIVTSLTNTAKTNIKNEIKTVEGSFRELKKAYESGYNDIIRERSSFKAQLMGGSVFEVLEEEDEQGNKYTQYTINDLKKRLKAQKDYARQMSALKERGLAQGLLDELFGMDTEQAAVFASQINKMSDAEFNELNSAYKELDDETTQLANDYYADEISTLQTGFVDKVTALFGGMSADLKELGGDGADKYIEALIQGLNEGTADISDDLDFLDQISSKLEEGSADLSGAVARGLEQLDLGEKTDEIIDDVVAIIRGRQGEVKRELLELYDVSGIFDDKLVADLSARVTAANNAAAVQSTQVYTPAQETTAAQGTARNHASPVTIAANLKLVDGAGRVLAEIVNAENERLQIGVGA